MALTSTISPDTGTSSLDRYSSGDASHRLVLSGSGTKNDTIVVTYLDPVSGSTVTATTKIGATGKWSLTTPTLADGSYQFTVAERNSSGALVAQLPPSQTWNIDTQTSVSFIGTSQTASSTNVVLKGTAEAFDSVQVTYVNSKGKVVAVGTATADASGAWTLTTALAAGSYAFSAKATDLAGNTATASQSVTVVGAPTERVSSIQVAGDNIVNQAEAAAATMPVKVVLTAALASGNRVLVTVGGQDYVASRDSGDVSGKTFLAFVTTAQSAGTVSARVENSLGASSTTLNQPYTVDFVAPAAPLLTLGTGVSDGATAAEATQASGVIRLSAEAGAAITVTFTNGAATVTKTFTGTGNPAAVQLTASELATLGNGTISVSATAKDAAGNTSSAGSTSFVLDTVAPPAPALALGTGVANGATASEAAQAGGVVTLAGESGAAITVTFTNGAATVTKLLTGTGSPAALQLTAGDLATLGNGTINVSATAKDAAGNTSSAGTTSFVLDTVAPSAPLLTLGTGVSDGATAAEATQASGVLRLSAETGAAITVTFTNGAATVTKTLTGTGSPAAVQLTAGDLVTLGDGTIDVSATASDAAGNPSPAGSTSFVLDTTAPSAPVFALGTGVADGATTAEATQASGVVTLAGEAGAAITVTFTNGAATVTKTLTGTGNPAAVQLTAGNLATLGDGPVSVSATAKDTAGNTGPAGNTNFVLDTIAPSAPVLALGTGVADGATAAEATQAGGVLTLAGETGAAITVTFTNGSATVTKSLTGTGSAAAVQLTAGDLATLGDGTIDVSAAASDASGNTSPAGSTSFVLDTVAPSAPALALGTGVEDGATDAEATQASGVVTLAGEAGAAIAVTFTNGAATVTKLLTGTGSAAAVQLTAADIATLGDGTIDVSATASDAAGNTSSAGSTSFVLDTAVPPAPVFALGTGVADGATAAEATQATGVVTLAGEAGAAITVTFSNGAATVTKLLTGTGSAAAVQLAASDLATLGDGTISVSATASNGAGNTSPAGNTSFVLDTVAPTAPDLAIRDDAAVGVALSNDNTLHLGGTAEAGTTVSVTWTDQGGNSTGLGTVVANAGGAWSLDTPLLADGTHTFSAVAGDAAGNIGLSSALRSVTIDTAAPTQSIVAVTVAGNNVVDSTEAQQPTLPVIIQLAGPLGSGESVSVTVGTTSYAASLDSSDPTGATYVASIASPQSAGSVAVRLQDSAGNISPATTQPFTFENTVPPPHWDHIVIVVEENHAYSEIIGNNSAPYINSLASQGLLFTNFTAAYHPSQPNYLLMFSGSPHGIVDGYSYLIDFPTVAVQLVNAGYSFAGYGETGAGERHMPWLTFVESRNFGQNLSAFPTDFNQLPTLSYVIANDDHNMHDGPIGVADTWLQDRLGAYATWATANNSLLIVTFDESSGLTDDGNRVATIIVGAGITPQQSDQAVDHYSLLHTIQSIYGLAGLGDSANSPVFEFDGLGPLNNIPVAKSDVFYSITNSSLAIAASSGVLANDLDRDNDFLSAVLVAGPTHGTLQLNVDGSFTYTPTAGYIGPDSFTYRATDGANPSAVATASLFAAPTAPLEVSFQQGVSGYSGVIDTMLRGSNPTTVYDQAGGLTVDSISPTGSTFSVQSLVQFTNLFGSGPGQIPLGSTIVSANLTLLTTDFGSGADLHGMLTPWTGNSTWNSLGNGVQIDGSEALASIEAHIGPVGANGLLTVDVSSTVQAWANGDPNYGWALTPIGTDGWVFASSETANGPLLSVVYVAPEGNRAPIALGESYATEKNSALTIASIAGVLANDRDFDGDALAASLVTGPAHGSLQLNPDGSFTYTPSTGYAGLDSFVYTANDAVAASAPTTVNLTVGTPTQYTVTFKQGVNGYTGTVDTMLRQDAPDSRSGTATALNLDSDDPGGTSHWSEALLRFDNLVGTGANQMALGAHVLSATLNLQTTDTGDGGEFHRMLQTWSNNDTWNTLINGIQADGTEAVTQIDASTGRVGSLGLKQVDVTSSVQAWADGAANHGWAVLPLGTDGWRFGSAEYTTPPTLTVVFEVYESNRSPVALSESYTTAKNSALTIASNGGVLVNDSDPDGDTLTASLVTGPAHGTLQLNPDGSFTYTPQTGYAGLDSFVYTANDAQYASAPTTVSLTVGTAVQYTVTIKQGVNGYTGTVDTMLRQDAPTSRSGTATALNLDTDDPGGTAHWSEALLRFDNLVGTGANQVPSGAHVLSATLKLQTTDTGDGGELHRMLQTWSNDSTWNTLINGIQADGTEALSQIDASTGRVGSLGLTPIDVTSSVQAWIDGAANHGWAILPLGSDGWRFGSAEYATPPALSIVYELYV
jgi:hypothetical protein